MSDLIVLVSDLTFKWSDIYQITGKVIIHTVDRIKTVADPRGGGSLGSDEPPFLLNSLV